MIDLTVNTEVRDKAIARCKELNIVIPTYAQQADPSTIPSEIVDKLPGTDLQEVHPLNLFRITWKNDPKTGKYGDVNHIVLPEAITGTKAKIVGIVGKHFPIGAHKVGAAFGCLAPRLVTGQFDPTSQSAVWPSTGNYCRGGVFDSALLGCTGVAILPEEMSKERFAWLEASGAEIIATPGCESNVKEIYDKCCEIKETRPDCVIFNQFEEFGNHLWHYTVTAAAAEEAFKLNSNGKSRLSGYVSATGSAGTIGAGDKLKELHPHLKIGAVEALQCPTLLTNGYGGHGIEGIGDKHVPWIHNVRNTDMVVAVDDIACLNLLRLFNEAPGQELLAEMGVSKELLELLPLFGISGLCNMIASIKMAKYYEMNEDDVIVTVLTDSVEMYGSRLEELTEEHGSYSRENAVGDYARYIQGIEVNHTKELTFYEKKAIHNLKYYTWVEQQGRTAEDLDALWDPSTWDKVHAKAPELDAAIVAFNKDVASA